MLFFIDESGHDHGEAPYEVLAAVAISERDLWNLVQSIRAAELEFFGIHMHEVGLEFKGKKLLKNKVFRHARQTPAIDPNQRRDLARGFLLKGFEELKGGPQKPRSRDEFAAYGQAAKAFVLRVLQLASNHHVQTFAALVNTSAPKPADANILRRDYAFLFQRFFFFLEELSPTEMGLVVFDELEKAQSRILLTQMERYFLETETGYQRSSRIVPEPFFVHSDLTTAVQLVDIVAYSLNWGLRLNRMTEPTRPDVEPFARLAFEMRYVGKCFDDGCGKEWPRYGIFYLDDLRPRREREIDEAE